MKTCVSAKPAAVTALWSPKLLISRRVRYAPTKLAIRYSPPSLAPCLLWALPSSSSTWMTRSKVLKRLQRALDAPTLGIIARIVPIVQPADALIAANHPKSSIAEAYRVLRTNVQFAALDNPATSLLITSAGPQEGKTTTVANLGAVIAQTGKRTLLVDADLRRPSLHRLFEVPNRLGLTNLLLTDQPDIAGSVQKTKVANLDVLTSGPQPPNPAELLGSKRMDSIIELAKHQYDVVLYDSPPVLAVADASILASKIQEVILVTDSGRTRSEVGQRAKQSLDQTGAKFLGVVLNRLTLSRSGYGYYYYYYYSSDGDQQKHKRPKSGVRAWLRRATRPWRHGGRHGEHEQNGSNDEGKDNNRRRECTDAASLTHRNISGSVAADDRFRFCVSIVAANSLSRGQGEKTCRTL